MEDSRPSFGLPFLAGLRGRFGKGLRVEFVGHGWMVMWWFYRGNLRLRCWRVDPRWGLWSEVSGGFARLGCAVCWICGNSRGGLGRRSQQERRALRETRG